MEVGSGEWFRLCSGRRYRGTASGGVVVLLGSWVIVVQELMAVVFFSWELVCEK